MEKPPETYKKQELVTTPIVIHEACERCGREAEFFYIWNGRKLCKSCLEEEQKKWGMAGGGPTAAPTRVVYSRGRDGLLGSLIKGLLRRIGLIRKERGDLKGEIVAAEPLRVEVETKKSEKGRNVVSFRYGKPMSEGLEEDEEEEKKRKKPQSEGLMKSKKKKSRKKAKKKKPKKK